MLSGRDGTTARGEMYVKECDSALAWWMELRTMCVEQQWALSEQDFTALSVRLPLSTSLPTP